MLIAVICIWLSIGVAGTVIGNRELRRRFPTVSHNHLWLLYFASILGPANLFAVWMTFFVWGKSDAR